MRHCLTPIVLAAGLASAASPGPPAPARWSVQVSTSGGFAGVGRGGVFVASDGQLAPVPPATRGRAERACAPTALSGEELRRIGLAAGRIRPEGWAGAKGDFAAPDAFHYRLVLTRGEAAAEERFEAAWHDNTRELLPADLEELYAGVEAAWQRAARACGR